MAQNQVQGPSKKAEKNVIAAVRFYIDKIVSDSSILGEPLLRRIS